MIMEMNTAQDRVQNYSTASSLCAIFYFRVVGDGFLDPAGSDLESEVSKIGNERGMMAESRRRTAPRDFCSYTALELSLLWTRIPQRVILAVGESPY